MDTRT